MAVLLLSHFNGTNGATSVADEVAAGNWTGSGGAALDTSVQQFGSASAKAASGGPLWTSPLIASSPHLGDWTAEAFIRGASTAGVALDVVGVNNIAVEVSLSVSGDTIAWYLFDSSNNTIYESGPIALALIDATFYHVAVVRSGTSYFLVANGNRIDTHITSTNVDEFDHVELFTDGGGNGWFDECRLADFAAYPGTTYTVPTEEFFLGSGEAAPLPHIGLLLGETTAISAEAGAVAITGQDAGLLGGFKLAADVGSVAITGTAADLLTGNGIEAPAPLPHLSTILQAVSAYSIAADVGRVTLTGVAASLLKSRTLIAEAGSITITGIAADFVLVGGGVEAPAPLPHLSLVMLPTGVLEALAGALTITGQDAGLLVARTIAADSAAVNIAGQNATLNKGFTLTADPGEVLIDGEESQSFIDHTLGAESGTVTLTGQDAGLVYSESGDFVLIAEAGSITITGQTAAPIFDRETQADVGLVTITGQDASLRATRVLDAAAGTGLQITGVDANLAKGRPLIAEAGEINITGQDATLAKTAYVLHAEPGEILITGFDLNVGAGGSTIDEELLDERPRRRKDDERDKRKRRIRQQNEAVLAFAKHFIENIARH